MSKKIYRGDDVDIEAVITDQDGNLVDVTGWEFILTVKRNEMDADDKAILQITEHEDTTLGTILMTISRNENVNVGKYYFDLQGKIPTDSDFKIKTLKKGCFEFNQDITLTTATD